MPLSTLAQLFDEGVACCGMTDFDQADPLHVDELVHVERAVEKRRRDFAAGRTCARRSLVQLGLEPSALPANEDRSVRWPTGLVGAITHTEGFAAAAVASGESHVGIGLDAEHRDRVQPHLWKMIATEDEAEWLRDSGDLSIDRSARLFSGKEAFYKAQHAITRDFLGFHDVRYSEPGEGLFEIELIKPVPAIAAFGTRFVGRYAMTPELVLTSLTITR